MDKVPLDDHIEACIVWYRDPRQTQRLGQYLMNTLRPDEVNPKIFYETDARKAELLFYSEYVQ